MLRRCFINLTHAWKLFVSLLVTFTFAFGVASAEQISPNAQISYDAYNIAIGAPRDLLGPGHFEADIRKYNFSTSEVYETSMLTSLAVQRAFRNAIPSVSDYSHTAYGQNENNWVVWGAPFFQRNTQKRNDRYMGYDLTTDGFAAGITRLLGRNSSIGLALGYSSHEQSGRNGYHLDVDADTFHSALYGGTSIGSFFVDAYAGYSRSSKHSNRQFTVEHNEADFHDEIWSAGIKAGYKWVLPGGIRITPAIGLDYGHIKQSSILEDVLWLQGQDVAANQLETGRATYHSVHMPVTVTVNKTFEANFLRFGGDAPSLWTPEIRGGFVSQLGSKRASVKTTDHLGYIAKGHRGDFDSFRYTADSIANESYGMVGAGLKLQIRNGWTFGVDYDYAFGSKYGSHVLAATFGISF